MELILLNREEKMHYRREILSMMERSDKEFVPPLSARFSTSQTDFCGVSQRSDGVVAYFEDMQKENMLAAVEEGTLLGFVTFKKDLLMSEVIEKADLPNLYVCTLIVSPEARGRGLTKTMYTHLFETLYPERNLFTRTWSTNLPHIRILEHFGFSELLRKENDRGIGIDTVYFVKRR